jgi:hypothetical protein
MAAIDMKMKPPDTGKVVRKENEKLCKRQRMSTSVMEV